MRRSLPRPTGRGAALAGLCWSALSLSGCLFNANPQCFPEEAAAICGANAICVDRRCVSLSAGDVGGGGAGGALDAGRDGQAPAPDGGPAVDAGRDDAGRDDASRADAARPDAAPAPEVCNGLDDDGDGRVDEREARMSNGTGRPLEGCDTYSADCRWLNRGHHTYLYCPAPVSQPDARATCAAVGLPLAVPENCGEAEWLGAAGESVAGDALNGWWLGLRMNRDGEEPTAERLTDGSTLDMPCWHDGEPNNFFSGGEGEACVDVLLPLDDNGDPVGDTYRLNDDRCDLNMANPVGALCEVPCDPRVNADGDGHNACDDCDDGDPTAPDGGGECPGVPL